MFDPQAECPDCGSRLGASTLCEKCGWKPERAARKVTSWTPEPFVEPTPEERAEIAKLIAETKRAMAMAPEPQPRKPLANLPKRCGLCDYGKFVHMHVRYCLVCYLALGKAS